MKINGLFVMCCLSPVMCAMELPREPVTPVLGGAISSLTLEPVSDDPMRGDAGSTCVRDGGWNDTELADVPHVRRRRTAESSPAQGEGDCNTLFLGLKQFTECCTTARLSDDLRRRGVREIFSRALQEGNLAVLCALMVTSDTYAPFLDKAQVGLLCSELRYGRFLGQDYLLRAAEQWLLRVRCADSSQAKSAVCHPQWVDLGL